MVIVGEPGSIFIPDLSRARQSPGRLRGLRLLHTHLGEAGLSKEDLMDMVFLRLDSVAALTVDRDAQPATLHYAQLLPPQAPGRTEAEVKRDPFDVYPPMPWDRVDIDFTAQAKALEDELARTEGRLVDERAGGGEGRAILVHVGTEPRAAQESSLDELAELARTAGLSVAGRMVQRVPRVNPRHILGSGKVGELEIEALGKSAGVIVFDSELSATQMRNLAEATERKVIDRTQLILDIFAQHATSRAGKLQVEMAQLKYTLPRLVGQNRALSRLMGGIGGRGPGETKLEMDRRKIRERITRIKHELDELRKQRGHTRARRTKTGLPIVSLVGYTNAGKSTLLNTLTGSAVIAENKLFATLDPTSRRLRFPEEREIILTDTVGFIRHLPDDLREAFRATLEELESADLLVLVADASHPEAEAQIRAVTDILTEMELHEVPRILALNKWDRLDQAGRELARNAFPDGVPVSALNREGLDPLVRDILARLPWDKFHTGEQPGDRPFDWPEDMDELPVQ
jgi:GTP-binding protein HflX